ncbi:MAG: ABC transporter permease, partial [Gammaproteobacteria bacterium]
MSAAAPGQHPGLIGRHTVAAGVELPQLAGRERRPEPGFPVGWLIAPGVAWLMLFLVIPLASIIVFSFWTSTGHGMEPDLTLAYYRDYFHTQGFFDRESDNFLTPGVFVRTLASTLRFTLEIMAMCLLIGYPIAYFLAMQVQSFKWQMALFLVCMVPFWTSYLIRAVAWLPMLGRRGLLNTLLVNLGIVDKPVGFLLYSEFGYTMALAQLYVVICVGPIFFSLAKIDKSLLEAARDMGATPFQIFREIIAPLSLPGVAIGMIFIFVMIMGEFATAVVVYGG